MLISTVISSSINLLLPGINKRFTSVFIHEIFWPEFDRDNTIRVIVSMGASGLKPENISICVVLLFVKTWTPLCNIPLSNDCSKNMAACIGGYVNYAI